MTGSLQESGGDASRRHHLGRAGKGIVVVQDACHDVGPPGVPFVGGECIGAHLAGMRILPCT